MTRPLWEALVVICMVFTFSGAAKMVNTGIGFVSDNLFLIKATDVKNKPSNVWLTSIYIFRMVKCEIDMKVNASKFWKQGNFANVENCNELTNISIRLHSVWKQTYSAHLAHLPDILVGLVSTLCWRKWTKRWGVDLHCILTDWSKQSS